MKRVYDVSLKEFAVQDGVALAKKGATELGRMNALELLQLLMIFQDISPVQAFEGEPTISICTRSGGRYLVRTDLHKLLLYDTRKVQVPAHVLEAASILLEIESDTAAQRIRSQSTGVVRVEQSTETPAVPKKEDPHRKQLLGFVGALVALLIVFTLVYATKDKAGEGFEPIGEEQIPLVNFTLLGTYSTGSKAEDYELALLDSGEVRLMQLGNTPPKIQKARYTIGMIGDKMCIRAPGFEPIYPEKSTLRMGKLLFQKK